MSTTTSGRSVPSSKKYVVPKVWKRPHSTIYGKNVEFGSGLYSDKIGEINSRKFNSELPYSVRNSSLNNNYYATASTGSDGYLSNPMFSGNKTLQLMTPASSNCSGSSSRAIVTDGDLVRSRGLSGNNNCYNFKDLLEATNPNRFSLNPRKRSHHSSTTGGVGSGGRVDFYATYLDDFNRELSRQSDSSLLLGDPLLRRKAFDDHLDFDYELGLFLPASDESLKNMTKSPNDHTSSCSLLDNYSSSSTSSSDPFAGSQLSYHNNVMAQDKEANYDHYHPTQRQQLSSTNYLNDPSSRQSTVPMTLLATSTIATPITKTNQTTLNSRLLPKHRCQLSTSPYGQSADGRKLSLSSIDPMSYRPPVPSKSTSAHASGGEEYELHDRSSPFYTDRWAGKTIRHFDSDLYSNAGLFKSMIL